MPLTKVQREVLSALSEQRSASSHLAGATGLLMSSRSPRRSQDVDLFHDTEQAVAMAFAADRMQLVARGYQVNVLLSQPGLIRAEVGKPASEQVRIDWAHDSCWRFLPPVQIEGIGFVLHPVDLAVNKVLALAGRDEARDFVDILYLAEKVLPLGALVWAASGKDPGLNPVMLIELLARKGRLQQRDLDRLDLVRPAKVEALSADYRNKLAEARVWIDARPAEEVGCLYRRPGKVLFFAPASGEACEVHRGAAGGVMPFISGGQSFCDDAEAREELESFFERPVKK